MKENFYSTYIKRCLDVVCAIITMIVFCWLYAIIAILVRIKLGRPVIFSQYRPGKNEKIFKLYKFRSMTNARDENGDLLPDSKRLTKFGRILRTTSLDELPEVWNIFKGDMSVVGPRPWSMFDLKYYSDEERKRFLVAPGLTGWAQVNGRNAADWSERLLFDTDYVAHTSFLLDVKIVFATMGKMLKRSNVVVRGEGKVGEFAVVRMLEEQTSTKENVNPSQEIGGFFEQESEWSQTQDFTPTAWLPQGIDSVYTFSGRDAIAMAIRDIQESRNTSIKRAYLPSYCSVIMAEPFLENGIKIDFYEVEYNNSDLEYKIDFGKNCDVFFAMQYFGSRNEKVDEAIRAFHHRGIPVIEDITHCLLDATPHSPFSDYCIASLRKWFAIPTGGYLMKNSGALLVCPKQDGSAAVRERIAIMERKRNYLRGEVENKTELITINQRLDAALIYERGLTIDPVSAGILQNLNIESVRARRIRNGEILLKAVEGLTMIKPAFSREKQTGCCPLFFPIAVENPRRNELKTYLERNGIYCMIHWPERMGTNCGLRDTELSLVCDQRYSEQNMYRVGECLRQFEEMQIVETESEFNIQKAF